MDHENNRCTDEAQDRWGISIWVKIAVWVKIAIIAALGVLLIAPALFIESLINDRERELERVIQEVSKTWGGSQTIVGPILNLPYTLPDNSTGFVRFMPKNLEIRGAVSPELKRKGPFSVKVYNADLKLSGGFDFPDMARVQIPMERVMLDEAYLTLHISDIRGVRDQIIMVVNGKELAVRPSARPEDCADARFSSRLPLDPTISEYSFDIPLSLSGSERLEFAPCGKSTKVSMNLDWDAPSFHGPFQPIENSAESGGSLVMWKILDFNRQFPQQWRGNKFKNALFNSTFGVELSTPTEVYEKSRASMAHGLLLLLITFVALFVFEMTSAVRLHPAQYLLIGLAIMTFHTLLLSISEQMDFSTGYGISSLATVGLITFYSRGALQSRKLALALAAILILVYGYSYWMLQMAEYALLAGSLGIFTLLSVIMGLTRNTDWRMLLHGRA